MFTISAFITRPASSATAANTSAAGTPPATSVATRRKAICWSASRPSARSAATRVACRPRAAAANPATTATHPTPVSRRPRILTGEPPPQILLARSRKAG